MVTKGVYRCLLLSSTQSIPAWSNINKQGFLRRMTNICTVIPLLASVGAGTSPAHPWFKDMMEASHALLTWFESRRAQTFVVFISVARKTPTLQYFCAFILGDS